MKDLGEFHKNSKIFLELLTIDEKNMPISVDSTPTVAIGYYGTDGVQNMDNVTLNTVDGGNRHIYVYEIPSNWPDGQYILRYEVIVQGVTHTIEETFSLYSNSNVEHDSGSNEDVQDEISETDTDIMIMPPEFQIPVDIQVNDNTIMIRPKESVAYNRTYTLVLDKSIQSITGKSLSQTRVIQFTSEYSPLYATPLELRSILSRLYSYFTLDEMYAALRDAGQKVHQLLKRIPDANNSRFQLLTDRDDAYFPATKFSVYEAAKNLLNHLLIKVIERHTNPSNEQMENGFKLGDFEVQFGDSSNDSNEQDNTLLDMIQALLSNIEREWKYWMDALMGRNARGYAKPITAVTRSSSPGPESRDI